MRDIGYTFNDKFNDYNLQKFSNDLKAGVTVFLVAIPLCLGIAIASGVPVISGLIAGVIGGIVIGLLSGSSLSVSGCAAGLVPIILSGVSDLGSIELFFIAVMFSGVVQYLLGTLQAGKLVHYIPFSVIRGMLSAIGIIIILKQIPHLLGLNKTFDDSEVITNNYGWDIYDNLMLVLNNISLGSVIISISCFVILFSLLNLDRFLVINNKIIKYIVNYIPSSVIVILLAVLINYLFKISIPGLALHQEDLVNLPETIKINLLDNLYNLTNVSIFKNILIYKYAIMIAVIGSIETLLSIEACDKLDRKKRVTPTDRELKAQGVGNFISGLLGGLPVTSVIIRTSVNIENNAETKVSTIIHGVLLLLSILLLAPVINHIPLAALASILVVTGYKLTHEKIILDMYKKGTEQFVPFIVTIIAIMLTDLLRGVLIGLLIAIGFILKNFYNLKNIKIAINTYHNINYINIKLGDYTTFLSKSRFIKVLNKIPNNSVLTFDFSDCSIIDYEISELIKDYIEQAKNKKIDIKIIKNKNINYKNLNFEESDILV